MMELNYKLMVLIVSVVLTGLTAGICFIWSNTIMPGIGRMDAQGFLRALQAMNREILNPSFILVFLGPVLLLFINTYLYKGHPISFWIFLSAAILFFAGIGLVTVLGNVPLNEILDATFLETLSEVELTQLRDQIEHPWRRWHAIRTWTSLLAFVLLLIGMYYVNQ